MIETIASLLPAAILFTIVAGSYLLVALPIWLDGRPMMQKDRLYDGAPGVVFRCVSVEESIFSWAATLQIEAHPDDNRIGERIWYSEWDYHWCEFQTHRCPHTPPELAVFNHVRGER